MISKTCKHHPWQIPNSHRSIRIIHDGSRIIPDQYSGTDVKSYTIKSKECSSLNSVNIPRLSWSLKSVATRQDNDSIKSSQDPRKPREPELSDRCLDWMTEHCMSWNFRCFRLSEWQLPTLIPAYSAPGHMIRTATTSIHRVSATRLRQ